MKPHTIRLCLVVLAVICAIGVVACSQKEVTGKSHDMLWTPAESPSRVVRVTSNLAGYSIPYETEKQVYRKFQQINSALQAEGFRPIELNLTDLASEDCIVLLDAVSDQTGRKVGVTMVHCRGSEITVVPDIGGGLPNGREVVAALRSALDQTKN